MSGISFILQSEEVQIKEQFVRLEQHISAVAVGNTEFIQISYSSELYGGVSGIKEKPSYKAPKHVAPHWPKGQKEGRVTRT